MTDLKRSMGCTMLFACWMLGISAANAQEKRDTSIKSYDAFFPKQPVSDTGLFIVHLDKGNYYFEIPDSLLKKDMLIVSRRAAMSSSEIDPMVAGDNAQSGGLMIQWDVTPDGKSILLKKVTTRNLMRFSGTDSAFERAIMRQTLDPILMSFPIKAKGKQNMSAIIDIRPLYAADVKELTPFAQNPLYVALGLPVKKYKFEADRSFISTAQSFGQNIEVRSMLTFTEGDNTYSILVNRSMVLLPEAPMQARFADDRVGYFVRSYSDYNESNPVKQRSFIARWRLEPKPEDVAKMRNGALAEPVKPVIFYIDDATPEKWVKYIRQGVEDWLPAFEAAGFKNAIVARDVPVNDPSFNPEDMRYSVIRYTASAIPNAKGPSVTDPRSGEILESDIIIYHNVFQLLKDWRFAQTAANDPVVRTTQIPDSILGEALRYVVAHEVGHALGLRHNMGASFAFPVDSLRSATFTQQYGTTPSIMDYARNNYVAQPEDKGVKLTPPLLGAYDKYAISWGYKPIPQALDAESEVPVLNSWIEKHIGDPSYRFGEGDLNSSDPSAMRESLGDNVVKASEYGVKNIKYIISHLEEWIGKKGESYEDMEDLLKAVLRQYERYIGHVSVNIAGIYQRYPVQGQHEKRYTYVSKEEQRKSVAFILKQYRELPEWLEIADLNIVNNTGGVRKLLPISSYIERLYTSSFQGNLLNNGKLAYLVDNEVANGKDAYGAKDLLKDIRQDVFRETMAGKAPDFYRQMLQAIYVDRLINISKFGRPVPGGKRVLHALHTSCFCLHDAELPSLRAQQPGDNNLYFQYMDFRAADKQFKIESLVLGELKDIRELIKKGIRVGNATPSHYDFLLKRINTFLAAQ
ncbi:zinc-dependent metalloprotease [Chitinophaga sp. XS-30]|uniref:zinc-dependent metalloprotease n=1 Tax=Chitinophaga sp. XS-30 TaxID=2604421 RepID=UPI0011DCCC52|nr:zinc-dependent metalloprotease [Chitinophaga sp. XS-30]QEH43852.1 zinc-dependent metalloprotease [Chitinophaga sp. XS-30]